MTQNDIRKKSNIINDRLIALLLIFVSWAVVGFSSLRIGQAWGRNIFFTELTFLYHSSYNNSSFAKLTRYDRLSLSVRNLLNKSFYHSRQYQDKWIAEIVFPTVTNGFYVDVGSGDGVRESNTKALDDLGWKGICIDPFPTGMETRTAQVFKKVVFSEQGQTVTFRKAGFTGGIEETFGHTKDWDSVKEAEATVFITTTLDEILSEANAPTYINYMNIDIEGAELEALKGLSFSRYKVGAFTIEHNWEEPKRTHIRELLESNGYSYVLAIHRDDFYISNELLSNG